MPGGRVGGEEPGRGRGRTTTARARRQDADGRGHYPAPEEGGDATTGTSQTGEQAKRATGAQQGGRRKPEQGGHGWPTTCTACALGERAPFVLSWTCLPPSIRAWRASEASPRGERSESRGGWPRAPARPRRPTGSARRWPRSDNGPFWGLFSPLWPVWPLASGCIGACFAFRLWYSYVRRCTDLGTCLEDL